ncbi:hypothetical protein TCAL_04265 [Tigriopus californicus]|uniref:Peptidase M12B domain-containing protein n=1 Tax=Tigriopus californicus TaxID=6832 RepID=A0A553PKL2_TIGCA|nr:A disintegrin and metalloproteinase with thrombospondin motifs adt-1-like [Tigriopus californicus]TRY78189.1 hypothetical protein TCAL_04265 [Tigriopus californicus]
MVVRTEINPTLWDILVLLTIGFLQILMVDSGPPIPADLPKTRGNHLARDQGVGYLKRTFPAQGRNAAPSSLYGEEIEYTIGVFGTEYELRFQQNKKLLPPQGFRMQWRNSSGVTYTELGEAITRCHYIHKDAQSVAALSDCGLGQIRGFVSTPNETFEITPLTNELEALFLRDPSLLGFDDDLANSIVIEDLYLVKRAKLPALEDDDEILFWENEVENGFSTYKLKRMGTQRERVEIDHDLYTEVTPKTVELGVFVDAVAYNNLKVLQTSDEMTHVILASINQVDAIYHLASLKQSVDFAIKVLEVQTEAPQELQGASGERLELLDAFCQYNTQRNDLVNGSPAHWDLGVLLTGFDLFHVQYGYEEYDTLGLTRTGALCHQNYSCLITEFGVAPREDAGHDDDSPPEPTAGFGAVYVLAHEIGHTLGMSHDGSRNSCPSNGFIMSSSRGNDGGETSWSNCSALSLVKSKATYCLNNSPNLNDEAAFRFDSDVDPGEIYDADFQCQMYLRDGTAMAIKDDKDMCSNLKCERGVDPTNSNKPSRSYPSGPALDGTSCGTRGMCKTGKCLEATSYSTLVSPWLTGLCTSGCIRRSMGVKSMTRRCHNQNHTSECEDRVSLMCPDDDVCSDEEPRMSRERFAVKKCKKLALDPAIYPSVSSLKIPPNVRGMPAIYSSDNLRQACLIFCKFEGPTSVGLSYNLRKWNTPMESLQSVGREADAFYPDGTWCHRLNGTDFYCVNHECISLTTVTDESSRVLTSDKLI